MMFALGNTTDRVRHQWPKMGVNVWLVKAEMPPAMGHFSNVPPVGDFVPPNVPPRCPGWGRLFVEACGSETASMLVVVLCFWMVAEPSGSTCGAGGRTRTGTVFSTGRF